MFNYAVRREDLRISECIDLGVHDVGTSWSCMVRFIPLHLYPMGKSPCTHWTGVLVGSRAGLNYIEKLKSLTLSELEFGPLGLPARSQLPPNVQYVKVAIMIFTLNTE